MSVGPVNRVVVTGVGAVSSLGLTFQETWDNILAGYSGIKKYEFEAHPKLPCKIAAKIPRSNDQQTITNNDPINNGNPPNINIYKKEDHLFQNETYYTAHAIQYALTAAAEAMKTSKLEDALKDDSLRGTHSFIDRYRIGVSFASGMGGMESLENDFALNNSGNFRKISPYSLPNMLINSSAGAISLRYGLHGPNLAPSTACAASAHALQEGYFLISSGLCDIVIVGGTEAAITPMGIAGFCRCKAVASKFNDNPHSASRPWDKNRAGFVMGEGAACLVLESESIAKKRGVEEIYGEIIGIGSTADAFHVTSLDPSGLPVMKCMENAIESGKRVTNDKHLIERLGYINAHATSTDVGDKTELKAILGTLHKQYGDINYNFDAGISGTEVVEQAIQENVKISGTKSSIGHLLGGSGAIESIITLNTLRTGDVPPTRNLDNPDDFVPDYVNLVPNKAQKLADDTEYGMSNSFGFGGTNASILFKKRNYL
eukprot:98171_1